MLTPLLDCPAPELKPGEERKESKEPRDFWAGGVVTLAAEGPWQLGLWAGWSQLRSGPWLAEGLPAQRQKVLGGHAFNPEMLGTSRLVSACQ